MAFNYNSTTLSAILAKEDTTQADNTRKQVTKSDVSGDKVALDVYIRGDSTSGGGGGVQYTEGDTDASITGNALMWEDSGDTLASVSASKPLPVDNKTLSPGAATETTLASILALDFATETTLSGISGQLPSSLGQKAMASSLAVVLASDQSSIPVSQSGTWNINNISGTISLPTGAATETTLSSLEGKDFSTETTLSAMSAKLPATLGQKSMAASLSVAIASDQSAVPISAASLPLPTGAATETTLASILALDFATETTLATLASVDFATQTTLAAINAKLVSGTDIGDVTVNNAGGGSAVPIQDGGNSITVDGSVSVSSVIPGVTATTLGKAEDSAHASGHTGVAVWAVRNDQIATSFSGTDGDYTPFGVEATGRVHSRIVYESAEISLADLNNVFDTASESVVSPDIDVRGYGKISLAIDIASSGTGGHTLQIIPEYKVGSNYYPARQGDAQLWLFEDAGTASGLAVILTCDTKHSIMRFRISGNASVSGSLTFTTTNATGLLKV